MMNDSAYLLSKQNKTNLLINRLITPRRHANLVVSQWKLTVGDV